MIKGERVTVVLSVALALASGRDANGASPPKYKITNLDSNGRGMTYCRRVNNTGQVVGLAFGSISFGRLYSRGRFSTLQPLRGLPASDANAVNDKGDIVGNSSVRILAGLHRTRACEWIGGKAADLGLLNGDNVSDALDINTAGTVVGTSGHFDINDMEHMTSRAVRWINGRIQPLNGILGTVCSANAINAVGTIAGNRGDGRSANRGFLYRAGKVIDLEQPRGGTCYVKALNDRDQAVGEGYVREEVSHALLWTNAKLKDLGVLPTTDESSANGINRLGDVVGSSGSGGNERAFLWRCGHMYDLNRSIPSKSGWVLTGASSINDLGQIVGNGTYRGKKCSFLLTPLPPLSRNR